MKITTKLKIMRRAFIFFFWGYFFVAVRSVGGVLYYMIIFVKMLSPAVGKFLSVLFKMDRIDGQFY